MRENDHGSKGAETGFGTRIPATKIGPPSPGVRHMPRPRLSAFPADADSFRLALVSAPAGSGKTTLLAEWYRALRSRGVAAAWLSLDAFDNEPRRFISHLIAAIRTARPGVGGEALELLAATPDVLVEDVVTSLAGDFGVTTSRTVVFWDDYHEIRDRTVHAVADYLLRYVPADIQFVLGTRKHPPLSIERLRVRGEVLEIGWEELRFNVDETRDYLKDVCRLDLSEDRIRVLCRETEGWITALQLAAMTFAGSGNADGSIASFTGAQRKIADYLMEGVFGRQTPAVKSFLLKTAILDRMTAPLCDALTGRKDGRQTIGTLESGNLFVFALDDHGTWYRYHHLFAEFLRHRLRTGHPDELAALYDGASEWFERNGCPSEAVRYAISGNRFRRAARLLESVGRELFRQGDFKELRRRIDTLPEGTVRRSPVLCVLHAWALAYLGEFDAAGRRIACAEAAVAGPARTAGAAAASAVAAIKAEVRVLRAVVGIIRTDEPDVSGLHTGIVALFPREETALRAYAYITLGFASRVGGYLSVALQHFREALVISDGAESSLVNLNARLNIGIVNHMMGRANDAEKSFRKSLDVAGERRWLRTIGAAFLRYGLALVLYDKNRLGEALDELTEAISVLEAGDAYGFLGMALVERARTQLALGRPARAGADLARARDVARKHHVERVSFRADLLESRTAVRSKDPDRAERFLESAGTAFGGETFVDRVIFPEKYESFLMEKVRVLVARGRFGDAARSAGKGLQSAGSAGRGRHVIEFLLLQAAAWNGLSGMEKAQAKLEQALILAGDEGIVRPFLAEELEIVPILRQSKTRENRHGAVAGILSALRDGEDPVAGKVPGGRGDEPFHLREVQILRLVAQGLRNREVGRRLFLSEETVKWYLKGLYGKLGVRTRTEAIARARNLGLLS